MIVDGRHAFFDAAADTWDIQPDSRLLAGLDSLGIDSDDVIVDLGCGTGVLARALCRIDGFRGRVLAIDYSTSMLLRAQQTLPDERVDWIFADAEATGLPPVVADRVFCFQSWPHFPGPDRVLAEVRRLLRKRGWLYIWHLESRDSINAMHRRVGGAVARDLLAPIDVLATQVVRAGFDLVACRDGENGYFLSARKLTDPVRP